MKRILTALVAMVMILTLFVGCGEQAKDANAGKNNSETVSKADKVFTVGLDDAFAPMGFRDDKNEIVGFDIDLAKEVGKRMGMEVKLQTIDWDSKELELDTGKIDVIWNGLTVTPERQEKMLLSKPYLANSQVIVVKTDSTMATKADMKDKKVCLQKGSSAKDALAKDAISKEVKEVIEMPDNVSALNDLKIGRVDCVVMDEVVARYYVSKESDKMKILDESLAAEQYAIAFKKDNTSLKEKVEKALADMVADGTTKQISEKWFGKDIFLK